MTIQDPFPPFITNESPSYERASEEFLHPSPPGEADIIALYAQLSEAEENAKQACLQKSELIEDESLALRVRDEASAHSAAREALGALIASMGGSAPRVGECRQILTRTPNENESDDSMTKALSAMRDELAGMYQEAANSPLLDEAKRAALAHVQAAPERDR